MNVVKRQIMIGFGMVVSLSAGAIEIATEFSADAVQIMPGQPPLEIKMYVSKKAVRTEAKTNAAGIVEIVYPKDNKRVLINQYKKTYIEQTSGKNHSASKRASKGSPCERVIHAKCKKMGSEKIAGRKTTKWEMKVSRNGKDLKSLHWIDNKYLMPLREQYPDGTIATMEYKGKETVNERKTEKWIYQVTRPDGYKMVSQQWYDPKLKMVIREMLPGGFVRELKNIKIGKQDKKLFRVPDGFKKETLSQHVPMMPPQQPAGYRNTPAPQWRH